MNKRRKIRKRKLYCYPNKIGAVLSSSAPEEEMPALVRLLLALSLVLALAIYLALIYSGSPRMLGRSKVEEGNFRRIFSGIVDIIVVVEESGSIFFTPDLNGVRPGSSAT